MRSTRSRSAGKSWRRRPDRGEARTQARDRWADGDESRGIGLLRPYEPDVEFLC